MLCKDFNKYNHQDVCKIIHHLRMKLVELVEEFSSQFLHLYCEIPERNLNSDFLGQEFKCLVHVSQYGEPPDFHYSPTLADHEAPQIAEEEPNTLFVPCPPSFLVPMWVLPCGDHKAEKSAQHVPNPSSHLSPASMEEVPEWLMKPIMKNHSSIL